MLDPIIINYKLTKIVSVTYYRVQQYPVKSIYNNSFVLNDPQKVLNLNVWLEFSFLGLTVVLTFGFEP